MQDGQNCASPELASYERVKSLCLRSPEVDVCSLSSSEQRGQELDSQTLECNGSWAPERFTTALFSL